MPIIPSRFKAGQTVTVLARQHETKIPGNLEVVRPLPDQQGVTQYRIRSLIDGHERVVTEEQLLKPGGVF